MKTKTIFLAFLFLPFIGFTQKVSFGINTGVNFNSLQLEKDLSLSAEVDELTTNSSIGFQIGIHSLIAVANRVKLSPQALLAFSEAEFDVKLGSDESFTRKMENVYIRFPVDIHLELLKGGTSLYLIGGVEYALNIANDEDTDGGIIAINDDFWSARLGLGFRKDLNRFSVSPELTFTKSFDNIEADNTLLLNEVVTNLDNSIVGLTLKFQGLLSN